MGKVVLGTTMSLDGFINDQQGEVGRLYPDFDALHESEMLQESIRTTGAVVMGKRAYDMAQGDFTGYEYQVPIFVLTHHAPQETIKGVNDQLTLTFVTDGIESAVKQAQAAAGDKDVTIVGGADTAQQCIRAGLVDELEIGLVPVLLGGGLRFFEPLGIDPLDLELIRVMQSPGRIDLRYRVIKQADPQ